MAQDYPGLTEYGMSPNDFKNEQGDIEVAVNAETLDQETAIWVAGNASISQESLSEALQMQMTTSGNAAWKDNMGLVQMMSPKDVGKEVWIRVRDETRRWAGPFGVIKSVDPERWYQWRKEDKVVEVSPEVGHQMNIGEKGTAVEVFWGRQPPDDSMGEAVHQKVPVLGFAMDGGVPMGVSAGIVPNRSPGLAQMPPGASMGLMQAATGMSQGQIRGELGGATDMRIGNDPVGAAIAGVQEARAGWVTDQVDPVLRRNSSALDWDPSMGSPYKWQGGQGGQGGQDGQGPISYPGDIFFASYEEGKTGGLNMLYELQMAGMPQSAIQQYAQENGMGFEEAVRALHSQAAVDQRWPSGLPWYVHMADSGVFGWEMDPTTGQIVGSAGNLADAARLIGVEIDNIPLDELLYSGDYAEGSWEHYVHDYKVGWTQQSYEDWTRERIELNQGIEGLFGPGSVPIDERMLAGLDLGTQTFPDSSELPESMAESTPTSSTASSAMFTGSQGPERAVISEYESGGVLLPKGEKESDLPTEQLTGASQQQSHKDYMHDLQQEEWAKAQGFKSLAHFFGHEDPEEDAPSAPSAPSAPASNQYEEDYEQWVDDINKASPIESGEPKADTGWAGMDEKEKLQKRAEHFYLQEQANIAEGW